MTERIKMIEPIPLDSEAARMVYCPPGFIAAVIYKLTDGTLIPVFKKLEQIPKKAQPVLPVDESGWGNRGLKRVGSPLKEPPLTGTTYAQNFMKQHANSVKPVLKPSDKIIRQL